MGQYKQAIPFHALPRTIQDSISVTYQLGFNYLWIDAFCIIQDSPEDKARELGKMSDVYLHAAVTIVASAAETCQDGFLGIRPRPRTPPTFKAENKETPRDATKEPSQQNSQVYEAYPEISLPFRCPDGSIGSIILYDREADRPEERLYTRAWTMQEYILSPRTLIYSTHQVFWKCRTAWESDGGSVDWVEFYNFGRHKLTQLGLGELHAFTGADPFTDLGANIIRGMWLSEWDEVVRTFSCMDLSLPQDKLPALCAIASEYQKLTKCDYIAGLWAKWLIKDLSWFHGKVSRLDHRHGSWKDSSRPVQWRCPSFSWASIDGTISLGYDAQVSRHDRKIFAVIHQCWAQPRSLEAPFGEVVDGLLEIEGPLVQVEIQEETDNEPPRHEHAGLEFEGSNRLLEHSTEIIAPQRIGRVLLDCRSDLDSLKGKPLWALVLLLGEYSPLEYRGIAVQETSCGHFLRVGYFCSLLEGHKYFSCGPRRKIIIK
jgi:hypothetical protein